MYNICHVFTYIHIEYMISIQVSIHDVLSQYDTYVYITWRYIYIYNTLIHIMFSCTVYPKRQCLQQLIPSSFRGMARHGPGQVTMARRQLTSFCCHRWRNKSCPILSRVSPGGAMERFNRFNTRRGVGNRSNVLDPIKTSYFGWIQAIVDQIWAWFMIGLTTL